MFLGCIEKDLIVLMAFEEAPPDEQHHKYGGDDPQAIRRYRMGPVSVDSMVTSRWNRTAVAGLRLAKSLPRGNDGWWAEYSTRNLKNQHIVFPFRMHSLGRSNG